MSNQQQKSDADEQGLASDSLRNVTVMNDDGLMYGLPSTLFIGGAGFSILLVVMLPFYIGIIFGVVYFTAMYAIHKDDPQALQGWMDAIFNRRKERWSGGRNKGRNIYFINKD